MALNRNNWLVLAIEKLLEKLSGSDWEPIIPPPPEPEIYIWDKHIDVEAWPAKIINAITGEEIRVGYVRTIDKGPLYYEHPRDGMLPYEDVRLRDENTTAAKRIIVKPGYWFGVEQGDTWGYKDPRPFGQLLDGDDVWYRVFPNQTIDGINLWEWKDLPHLYILFQNIGPSEENRLFPQLSFPGE